MLIFLSKQVETVPQTTVKTGLQKGEFYNVDFHFLD